jgi:hypothetical protein
MASKHLDPEYLSLLQAAATQAETACAAQVCASYCKYIYVYFHIHIHIHTHVVMNMLVESKSVMQSLFACKLSA